MPEVRSIFKRSLRSYFVQNIKGKKISKSVTPDLNLDILIIFVIIYIPLDNWKAIQIKKFEVCFVEKVCIKLYEVKTLKIRLKHFPKHVLFDINRFLWPNKFGKCWIRQTYTGFVSPGLLEALNILIYCSNFYEKNLVCSISQNYLSMDPFFQSILWNRYSQNIICKIPN